jgi:hypothetical protein
MKLTASSWEKITPLAFRNDVNNSAIQVIDTIQWINSDIMQITKRPEQIQSNDSKEDLN